MKTCSIFRHGSQWIAGAALTLALGWRPALAQAQTYTDLHDFNPAVDPLRFVGGRLAQGVDGNFYSTSDYGGTSNGGTTFRLTPSGTVTITHGLVSATEGNAPEGGLTLGADGDFYGNTVVGGSANYGTVFKVTPAGSLTVLHTFTNTGDGSDPAYPMLLSSNGNFYGATYSTPATIYQIAPSGAFRILHTLTSAEGTDGGQLSQGSDGNIYGSAGASALGTGTAFKVTHGGVFTVLHTFQVQDGINPEFGLIQSPNGIYFGTTQDGRFYNAGTIYALTSTGTYRRLHTFNGTTDGGDPYGQLLLASNGNMYGNTALGGTFGCGTIFKLTAAGGFTVIYNFDCTHGGNPEEQLNQGTNGLLYGLVNYGGAFNNGVFFSLDLGLPAFASLVSTGGRVGAQVGILGQGFDGTSVVTFGGVQATSIGVKSTFISAVVPAGALSGKVTVTTGATVLTSLQSFKVRP